VATLKPNGATVSIYYIHSDPLNTPRQIARPSDNAAMWTWNSDPFGTDAANPNPSGAGAFAYNLRASPAKSSTGKRDCTRTTTAIMTPLLVDTSRATRSGFLPESRLERPVWIQFFSMEFVLWFIVKCTSIIHSMKRENSIGSVLAVVLCATGCSAMNKDEVVEAKDIQFFKVEPQGQLSSPRLRVSGLVFRSSMSVNRITEARHESQLNLLVHVQLARPGTSGSFSYDVSIPSWAEQVTFGKDSAPIWSRPSAPKD
jgi:hypothetical protein